MPKVTSGIRKTSTELEREKKQRYRAKQKTSPEKQRLEKVVTPKQKAEKVASTPKEKPLARFVGLDGEGKNDPTKNFMYTDNNGKKQKSEHQDYVLLRSSSEKIEPLYNPNGLTTVECFSYLCNLSLKEYGATFVGFGLSYDITMWMRDIEYKDQQYLRKYMAAGDVDKYEYEGEGDEKKKTRKLFPPVYFAEVDDVPNTNYVGFEYEHMPRKWFKLTRYEMEMTDDGKWKYKRDSKGKRIKHGSITIYDVWGFFQSTFVNALSDYGMLTNEADYQFLKSMKSKRDQFEYMDIGIIDDYCKKECVYLVKLMEQLQEYFRHPAVNIPLSRWDGAGAAASVLLKEKGIKEHLPVGEEDFPHAVFEASLHAYSGGRIELIQYGHTHSIKEYTEKQAIAYLKKQGNQFEKGVKETLKEEFIKATFLRRNTTQKLVNEVEAITGIVRLVAMKGVPRPYREKAIAEYTEKYITPYMEHYYTFDHVGYFRPCLLDYDINSAYPTTTAILPSLKGGRWELLKEVKTSFAMVHVKWNLSGQRFFPFFYRTKNHMIVYPTKGENWVWLPEYEAYLKHVDKFQGSVEVIEVWNFYPASDCKPFDFIPEMAEQRLEWKELAKKTNNAEGGQHVAVKLALNSVYGKLAQQVGGEKLEDGSWKLPSYLNMAWAGYITADTRAKLFDAAMQKPDSVVMFATDGLFITEKIDLPLSKKLGEWEVSRFSRFTAVQAGVYYRETQDWQSLSKSRGFEKGSISEHDVLDAWKLGPQKDEQGDWQLEVTGSSRQFVTFGKISVGEKESIIKRNMKRLCSWERKERKLSLNPNGTKRMDDSRYDKYKRYERLVPTIPLIEYLEEYSGMSTKYRSPFYIPVEDLTEEDKKYIQEEEEKQEAENIG